jgi:hypothetical protein
MNEQDQLGGLYAVAQEQQAAAGQATAVMVKQGETIAHAVRALASAAETLKAQPKAIEQAVVNATADTVRAAIALAASEATGTAQQIAEKAARGFAQEARQASEAAKLASDEAATALRDTKWWAFLIVFLAGLVCGSVGLYMLRQPAGSPVTLDPAAVSELLKPALVDACKAKK